MQLKDWLTLGVALLAVLLSCVSIYWTWRNHKSQTAIQSFLQQLKEIEDSSARLANRIEDNIRARFANEDPADHHRENLKLYRSIQTQVEIQSHILDPIIAQNLLSQFGNFWWELSGSTYPVASQQDKVDPSSYAYIAIGKALEQWRKEIGEIRQSAVSLKLKCWK
jgi:hypothetical protein